MTNDYLYYWDKIGSSGTRYLLGEIQVGENGFNISSVVDGTKDSSRMVIKSFTISETIKPNTIVWHQNTDTYFVVAEDRVEKQNNEIKIVDNEEIRTFLYVHNLKLEGAIELLNARDLTDCGFNTNTYTIETFSRRLFKLSNFELDADLVTFNYQNNIDGDKVVDYLKSFENYTLLSALREFFDGYNCACKMRFTQDSSSTHYLKTCVIRIYSKAGNIGTHYDIDETFNDIKEIKSLNKNSYGQIVVSNADNVVSTKQKTFPTLGYTRLSSQEHDITPNNACLRLPSNVQSIEYVKMARSKVPITIGKSDNTGSYDDWLVLNNSFDPMDYNSYVDAINWLYDELMNDEEASIWVGHETDEDYWDNLRSEDSFKIYADLMSVEFYNVEQYDPINNIFIDNNNINRFKKNTTSASKPYVLTNKELRDSISEPNTAIYWERGSNLIKGFNYFSWNGTNNKIISADKSGQFLMAFSVVVGSTTYTFHVIIGEYDTHLQQGYIYAKPLEFDFLNVCFKVKYTPMTDLKIKYDNSAFGNDIQIYNQNGKYTDANALSSLMNSYKTEIESDNITRYKVGYSLSSMPKAGDIVMKNDEKYIINNVSLDFFINEESINYGYFIVGEYTLSKNVATKSLLVSPNTDIRDYSIPQKYNVKRKQLYRDFYELDYEYDSNSDDDYYLSLLKVLNATNFYTPYEGHVAIMKLTFDNAYGGGGGTYDGGTAPASDTWYYQLETTSYFLKKSIYEVVDFGDNNIIGYSSQNVFCGFDIRRIFSGSTDIINTPISYVDNSGKVKGINILMCNPNQLMNIYDEYLEEMEQLYSMTYDGVLYNYSCFIPQDIYDKANNHNHDFKIVENNYKKDAIEVPVFEYSCQIDDTDNVIIGENILDYKENDLRYMYEVLFYQHGIIDNNTWSKYITKKSITFANDKFTIDDTSNTDRKVSIVEIDGNSFVKISCYDTISVISTRADWENSQILDIESIIEDKVSSFNDKIDVVVVRYTIPTNYTLTDNVVTNAKMDLFMVLKDAQNCQITDDKLLLFINHYKLN